MTVVATYPKTSCGAGLTCGTVSDGCGGTVSCGSACSAGNVCSSNHCCPTGDVWDDAYQECDPKPLVCKPPLGDCGGYCCKCTGTTCS
jgi:hypothetical protein